jgi:imidazolonepropionase-like amidohydrolase
MVRSFAIAVLSLYALGVNAQGTFPTNGPTDERDGLYAFTHATLHPDASTVITDATLVIRKGRVEAVGTVIAIPQGAVVVDLKGKHIYPSFIDLYSNYGLGGQQAPMRQRGRQGGPQMESNRKGAFGWNEAIKADFNAADEFAMDTATAVKLRKAGFGAVLTHRTDGIVRGSGALVLLGEGKDNQLILSGKAAAHYSFNKGTSTQDYPSSLMGSIALLRQTLYDAQWYAQAHGKPGTEFNLSLEAMNALQTLPAVFDVDDKLTLLRADRVGDEFNIPFIIKGGGDEYQRIEDVKATGAALIVPLNFPLPYDVDDPYDAAIVSLAQLMHWEWAPMNAALLDSAGVKFALTSFGLKNTDDFLKNLRKAVQYGLKKESALRALTQAPAEMMGSKDVGTLEAGKVANFFVASEDIFSEKAFIYENWVAGKRYAIVDLRQPDIRGTYVLNVPAHRAMSFEVVGTPGKPVFRLGKSDTSRMQISGEQKLDQVTIVLEHKAGEMRTFTRLNGMVDGDSWSGRGQVASGGWTEWSASRTAAYVDTSGSKDEITKPTSPIPQPFGAYGWLEKPEAKTYVIRNATVWTNEADGNLITDVLVRDGKISAVGRMADVGGAIIIDGTGKHLTNGIIDEHSHIAISRGVNEGTQSSSAEVRIGDVINSEDINIYRNLAGGVTAVQQLHGSANPIGGQSSLIKLRWGSAPEAMKIAGSDPYIKFALGENVKQSNWGDLNRIRYPQTRMGVEQTYYDHFTRARAYDDEWKAFSKLPAKQKATTSPPRRDLELDALAEILNSKRFITCHSYQQGEINMLMHVADSFGFKVNTFTHILEGYKVADKMKAHGVGASSFADWWAYKYEVIYAIPYNAAILDKVGVVTAINSDDAEMARRLNHEAAKTVKYGGVTEIRAWKMVTLNPAKLLHIDDQTGSIEVGKDADLVLWSDNPLSVYAKAEWTMVDGVILFDRQSDLEMREWITQERMRLIGLMIEAKKRGAKTQKADGATPKLYHCDDVEDEGN